MKKILFIPMVVLFLLTFCQCSDSETTADKTTANEATASEENIDSSTENEAQGRTTEINDYRSLSNEKFEWWFKRNKENLQPGATDEIDFQSYNAYYIEPESKEKNIFLTFDCGYENGYTNEILDILQKENVKAAFFVTKSFIEMNPEIVIRMKAEGHIVGNHTVTHSSMPSLSDEEIRNEIFQCENAMETVTGYKMDMYFRPPMGEYSERTLAITRDLGYTTVFWSIAYLDYDIKNQPGIEYVVNHFNKYCHQGAIPLVHNVSSSNAGALSTVINNLKK